MSIFPYTGKFLDTTTNKVYSEILQKPNLGSVIIKVQKYILTKRKTVIEGLGTVICCMNSKRLESKQVRFLMNEKYKQNYISEYIICLSTLCIPIIQTSFSFNSSLTALMLSDFTKKSSDKKILHISDDLALNKILEKLSSLLKFSLQTCTSLQCRSVIIKDKPTILLLGFCEFDGELFNLMPLNSKLIIYREKCHISGISPSEFLFNNKKISGMNVYNWYSSLGMYKRCKILNYIKYYTEAFDEDIKEYDDWDTELENLYECEKWILDVEKVFQEEKYSSENVLEKIIKEIEIKIQEKENLEEVKDLNDSFKEESFEEDQKKENFIEEHLDEKKILSEDEDIKNTEEKCENLESDEDIEKTGKNAHDEEELGKNKENISEESEKIDDFRCEEKHDDEHFNEEKLEKSDKDSKELIDDNIENPEKTQEKNSEEKISETDETFGSHLEEDKTEKLEAKVEEKEKEEEKDDSSNIKNNAESYDESVKVDIEVCENPSDKNKEKRMSSKSSSSKSSHKNSSSKSSHKSSKKSSSKSSQKSSESDNEKQIDS
ncbi:hypothetical protein SteCoe_16629 [Stentor coeruleus]|uniref:Uncharacterized protein n=1 Tax=Stentor coeruleus TaxID=5963 RepID=A0A1R2C135_9CILI|nr:hypothetical protein SteCoe_16629 [Stentor coeruleus]